MQPHLSGSTVITSHAPYCHRIQASSICRITQSPYGQKNWTGNEGLALSAEMASSLYLEITLGGAFASGLG